MAKHELTIMEEKLKNQVDSVCMSYRHDFGLLKPIEQASLRQEAKFWIEAIIKEIPYLK